MTKQANESFSAFLDGEATELDIQRMLKALDEQPGLHSEFHSLSRAQAMMNGDVTVDVAPAMTRYASKAASSQLPDSTPRVRILQGGIAATIALAVIAVAGVMMPGQSFAPVAEVSVVPQIDQAVLAQQQAEAQSRLDMYLKEHSEQASFTSGHAVVPADVPLVEEQQP